MDEHVIACAGRSPGDLTRRDEKGAGYGEVSSAWANRGQPANSKGGNWWQSPLCGAHTDRHFRESPGFATYRRRHIRFATIIGPHVPNVSRHVGEIRSEEHTSELQ